MDMPLHANMHPQSLVMEMNWVSGWFQRILFEASKGGNTVLITDRSPISAVFYTQKGLGALLAPLISAQIQELREAGVEIYTVHIKCDTEVLWDRVKQRLVLEPERAMYKEDSTDWLNEVKAFYDLFPGWDFTVENNSNDRDCFKDLCSHIVSLVSSRSPHMREISRKYFRSVGAARESNNENHEPKLLRLDDVNPVFC